jgi:hypothetical protein
MSSISREMPDSNNWSEGENVEGGTPEDAGTPTPMEHTPTQQNRPEAGGPDAHQLTQALSSLQGEKAPDGTGIGHLPNELLRKVVDELPPHDVLKNFALASRRFNDHLDPAYRARLKASARLEDGQILSGHHPVRAAKFNRRLDQLDSTRERPGDDRSGVLVELAKNTDTGGIRGTDSVSRFWEHLKNVPDEHPDLPEMLRWFNPGDAPEQKREAIRGELVARLEQTVAAHPENEDADLAVRRQAMLFVASAENSQDIHSRAATSRRFLGMHDAVRNAEGRGINEPDHNQLRTWSS